MTVQYKGYEIIRQYRDGQPDSLVACFYGNGERALYASSYQNIIEWIDFIYDGKEPEGYFNQY